jgi:predicted TIM-barrel fold metal-dependent hydrolase
MWRSRRTGRRLRRSLPMQVLLGSDYPFGTSADGIRGLEEYGLKPRYLEAIYRGNAERLLPRLKV